jgi:hypothetical protein
MGNGLRFSEPPNLREGAGFGARAILTGGIRRLRVSVCCAAELRLTHSYSELGAASCCSIARRLELRRSAKFK